MVTVIHYVHKVALCVSTPAVNSRLVVTQRGYSHEQKSVFECRKQAKMIREIENVKKKADMCQEF